MLPLLSPNASAVLSCCENAAAAPAVAAPSWSEAACDEDVEEEERECEMRLMALSAAAGDIAGP